MAQVIAALCRHGKYVQPEGVPSAHLPHPLTVEGRAQARRLGEELMQLAVENGWGLHPVIDSSPLLRAYETAQLAAERLEELSGTRFVIEEFSDLTERCVGAAANLTVSEIEAVLAADPRVPTPPPGWKSQSDYRLPLPGAESLLEAGNRVGALVGDRCHDLRRTASGTQLKIFVGHGASFRHGAVMLGALSLEDIPKLSMHYAKPVCLLSAEVGPYRLVAGAWKQRSKDMSID